MKKSNKKEDISSGCGKVPPEVCKSHTEVQQNMETASNWKEKEKKLCKKAHNKIVKLEFPEKVTVECNPLLLLSLSMHFDACLPAYLAISTPLATCAYFKLPQLRMLTVELVYQSVVQIRSTSSSLFFVGLFFFVQ